MSDFALSSMVGVPFMDDATEARLSRPRERSGAEAPRPNVSSAFRQRQGPSGPTRKEGPNGPSSVPHSNVKQAASSPLKARGPTVRPAASAAVATPFFDDGTGLSPSFSKGPRGNVSPEVTKSNFVKDSRQQREALQRREAPTQPKKTVRQSSLDFNGVALGLGKVEEDCVERPEGDYRGPGKWRGAWFNWCKDT